MGLSLRNITKKIGDVVGGVERQINPFDNGATYANAHPASAPAAVAPPRPAFNPAPVNNFQFRPQIGPVLNNNSPVSLGALQVKPNPQIAHPAAPGNDPVGSFLHSAVNFIPQASINYSNTFANLGNRLAGGKNQTVQQNLGGTPFTDAAIKYTGATGSGRQIAGNAADIAINAASPLAEKGASLALRAARPVIRRATTAVTDSLARADIRPNYPVAPPAQEAATKAALPKVSLKAPKAAVGQALQETPKPNAPAQADTFLNRLKPIVDRLNSLGGSHQQIAQGLVNKRNYAEKALARARFESPTISKLKKPDQAAAIDVLETGVQHTNPQVNQAAQEMKDQFNKVFYRAKATGKQIPYRKSYFPHFVDVPKTGSGDYNAAVDHLIKTGQAKDPAEASKLLEFTRQSRGQTKFGSFENKRVADLPGYAKTAGAYHHYLEEAYKQIGHYKSFGVDDQKLNAMLNRVSKEGGDVQKARQLFNEADNRKVYSPTSDKISNALTTFQGGTKLGTSAIGNLAQQGNNIIAGGVGRTIKAAVKGAVSRSDQAFIRKTGVTSEQVAREAIQSRGTTGVIRQITSPLFQPVEKGNRAVGALTGRDQANSIAGRLAKAVQKGDSNKVATLEGQLRSQFGIQGKIGPQLTEEQQIDAARKFVERTQFRTGAQDLPSGVVSPLGRVVTQFKRYPYKQTQFLGREVIKPLGQGNVLPLARTAGIAIPTGAGVNLVRNKISGRDTSKDNLATTLLDASQSGGGTGLETNLARSLNPLGSKDANAYIAKAAGSVGGPTVGDVVNTTKAGYAAAANKPGGDPNRFTPAERIALQHVPVVGRPIANRALPYGSTSQKPTNPDGTPLAPAGPAGRNAANTKNLTANDRVKQSFTTPQDKKFLALSDADKKSLAAVDPNIRKIYDEWLAAKSAFGSPKLYAPGLDAQSTSTLKMFDRLTTQGRDAVYARQPDAEYRYALAKYQNDKLNGSLTETEDIRRQDELAKLSAGSTIDKNTRDLYGLSKKDLSKYVSLNPSAIAGLQSYDQALANAGLIASPKFKNGFGTSGSSSSSSKSASNPYKYALSVKSGGLQRKIKKSTRPKVSLKKAGSKKIASTGSSKSGSKTGLRKSLV